MTTGVGDNWGTARGEAPAVPVRTPIRARTETDLTPPAQETVE